MLFALKGTAKSPRNASGHLDAVDMDTSNETVMSSDLSTSAVRRDIREKWVSGYSREFADVLEQGRATSPAGRPDP